MQRKNGKRRAVGGVEGKGAQAVEGVDGKI